MRATVPYKKRESLTDGSRGDRLLWSIMSTSGGLLSLDNPDQTVKVLTGYLETFVARWDAGNEPPALADYLPDESGDVRRWILTELIKIDLEYRWQQQNHPKRIEEYLREFPELREGGIPVDLIYEEFHIRRQAGLQVDPQEYLEQFPDQATAVRQMLGLNEPYASTSLFHAETTRKNLDLFEPGQSLDDFDLLSLLGQGAFARVFLARQKSMQRLVALKISADRGTEPQTLAQLDHDHIVRVFDQRPLADRGLRLLYMQYVAGGTLQAVARAVAETPSPQRTGALLFRTVGRALEDRGESRPVESSLRERLEHVPWPDVVCWIGARLAQALDYAHRKGVLHNDIKPANVLLSADGVPKLTDFNVSFAATVVGITPASNFGGSPAYMSPEQLEAFSPLHERQPDSLDGRSDLYSLGLMLWELLAGRRPFTERPTTNIGALINEMIAARRRGIAEDERATLPPGCPPHIVRVLERCLAGDADQRWQSGAELARQLDLCLKPRALELLFPPAESRRVRLRPWAVTAVVVLTMLPNAVGAAFTTLYNQIEIEAHLQHVPHANERYMLLVLAINAVAFPVGLGTVGWLTKSAVTLLHRLGRGEIVERERLATARRRSLLLGHSAALIGVVLWAIAGLVYPVLLHLLAGSMPPHAYVQLLVSNVIGGLIAASYPFFLDSQIGIRTLYPGLMPPDLHAPEDVPVLHRLRRLSWRYLLSAASVPMLGVVALVVMSLWRPGERPEELFAKQAMIALGLGGVIGLGFLYRTFQQLQADLDALGDALGDTA